MSTNRFPTFTRVGIRIGRWGIRIGKWLVRITPRVLLGLLVLFVLAAIPWTYFNIKWGRELEAELAALKAQGMPLTMVEAAPKPVPDDQNAAVLYNRVFKLQWPPATPIRLEGAWGGLSAEDLDIIEDKYPGVEPSGIPEDLEAQARAIFARPNVQEMLSTLREGSLRPYCVFPVNWEDGPGTLFPHCVAMRGATRILAAYSKLLAAIGKMEEALDWCAVALRMSEHAASEPSLIGQLVSIAMRSITFKAMEQFVSGTPLPPATVPGFERALREIDPYEPFTAAMMAERTFGLWLFDMVQRERRGVAALVGWSNAHPLWDRLYCSPLNRPLQALDALTYLEFMGRQIEISKLPYREAREKYETLRAGLRSLPVYRGPVTKTLSPVFSGVAQKRDYAVAEIGLCRVVMALKAYKFERNVYPDTLRELEQSLDWTLPEDPFSGKDFVYKLQREGFVLYSFGQDLDDDGGESEEKYRYKDGDIVWECAQ